ncbi:hypothetical protein CHLRE_07g353325v5 [Chlamydomonas reinhardtii]|uniref:Uncharacterized protein n=1 Tax=Chlamydomonas reinhardtii TaxID=3055 RepID=A0A2K3DLG1_CHLRE|nr:uncharacterized protein CHLRE_07g353325v5 [Chlamydomonas reinhardtii]PNW81374.1 hypothetical protein CHLRE_07g353325v5 [Chlamydomonas reinhardtii]
MWQLSARSKLQASPVQVATCHAGYSQRASAPAWAARYGCRRQLTLVSTFATGSPPTAWMLAPGRCPSYFRGEITTSIENRGHICAGVRKGEATSGTAGTTHGGLVPRPWWRMVTIHVAVIDIALCRRAAPRMCGNR